MTALNSSAAIANTVKTKISREAARIHLPGAGARDRPAHIGMREPGVSPVATALTSCTGALPPCAAAMDRVTAGYLSVGEQTRRINRNSRGLRLTASRTRGWQC